jgi:Trypsin-co-occurring domain 2
MRNQRVLPGTEPRDDPPGAVPLAAAIGALRDELTRAWWDGRNRSVRFKPAPVELSLQVGVTSAGKGSAGVKWWLIELGGEISRQSAVVQTVKVTLEPRMFDESTGEPLEFLIDAPDEPDGPGNAGPGEDLLDADG